MRGRTRIAFCGPTGANAVEAALKLAKTATGRSEIIAFHGGYHGGSHGAMAVSGGVAQKAPVAGQMPGVHFFPYPDPLHCALGGDPDTLGMRCAEYLDRALRDPIGGVTLPAAVILEVVQGEGGVVPASTDFLQGVRRTTRELGIPLIVDEIQCGCGRTGSWFAFEPHGIDPDVVILSKALGGVGMPVAVILYDESLDAWAPGAHTGTFRGNQAAFAAGVAFLRVLHRDHVLDNVRARGDEALTWLQEIAAEHPEIRAARGAGLMLGLEFASPGTPRRRSGPRWSVGSSSSSAAAMTRSCGCFRRSTSRHAPSGRDSRSCALPFARWSRAPVAARPPSRSPHSAVSPRRASIPRRWGPTERRRRPTSAQPLEETDEEVERKVTALELFFDLVFVFAFTQVTAAMAADPTWDGLARGMLVLGAVWWAWVGYAWLTNAIDPEEGITRLAIFAVMAAMLVVSLAIPEAFDDDALIFALAYTVVRLMQIVLFAISDDDVDLRHAVRRLGTATTLSCSLLICAAFLDGTAQGVLWLVALTIDFGGGLLSGSDGWNVSPGHFAERHGLIIIIALGESIVALGAGASESEVTDLVIVSAVLGTTIVASMWWTYFDVVAIVAERHLHGLTGAARNAEARDSYSYIHLLMIAGVVLTALGIKKVLLHVDEPLADVPAAALCGGVALYLWGTSSFACATSARGRGSGSSPPGRASRSSRSPRRSTRSSRSRPSPRSWSR